MKRKKLIQSHAKKLFSRTASVNKVKRINLLPVPMRGGFRI